MEERKKVLELFEKHKGYTDKRIEEGIENNRKGWACIRVEDSKGNPLKNAQILVKQKTHEFKYGANLFMLEEMESAEKNQLYKKYFSEAFNIATLPFYWKDLEPIEGELRFSKDSRSIYRRPPIDLCIEFCKEHGIEPREHCLNYDEIFVPDWVIDKPVDEVKEKLEKRMEILSERYADVIPCWEVTNETLFNNLAKKTTSFYHEPDFVEWSFETADKYFPKNKLVINESHWNIYAKEFNFNRSAYFMQIERALAKGSRIDAIGMQFHMFYNKENEYEETRPYYDPMHLYTVLDYYAKFEKPMHITEVTIPAYSNAPEDEAIQAQILEKLYSIWFSHPNIEQIIYWNLVDGYAAFAPQGDMTAGENYFYGGLIRFDLTPKPAYYKIKNLFEKVWHTEEAITCDSDGNAKFKGFYGNYEVIIDGKKYDLNLEKGKNNEFIIKM